jgi:hypothetical protein
MTYQYLSLSGKYIPADINIFIYSSKKKIMKPQHANGLATVTTVV